MFARRLAARTLSTIAALTCSTAFTVTPLAAQGVTIGTANTTNTYPIGTGGVSEFQQIYSSDLFSGPLTISSINFFGSAGASGSDLLAAGGYRVYFMTTTTSVADAIANFPRNMTGPAPLTLFGSFVLAGNESGSPTTPVWIGTPYSYDPTQGNLLLDIVMDNAAATPVPGANLAADSTSGRFAVLWHPYGADNSILAYNGVVTEFNAASTAPEPSSLALLGTGLVGLVPIVRRRLRA